uniref:Uncharacterized protein n=1 Tax=Fagus sylvatica TaxID=28930 RepID=A0A2N9H1C6_FAGSY
MVAQARAHRFLAIESMSTSTPVLVGTGSKEGSIADRFSSAYDLGRVLESHRAALELTDLINRSHWVRIWVGRERAEKEQRE